MTTSSAAGYLYSCSNYSSQWQNMSLCVRSCTNKYQ